MKLFLPLFAFLLLAFSAPPHAQNNPLVFQPAEMHHELRLLETVLKQFHPGLYRFNSSAQIDSLFGCARVSASRPMSERKYYLLLASLCEKIRCGHTYPNFWNQEEDFKARNFSKTVMPLLFQLVEGKFIVTQNLSTQPVNAGDELLSINGITADSLRIKLLDLSRSDGRNAFHKKLDNLGIYPFMTDTTEYALFDVYAPMLFPQLFNAAQYQCIIRSAKGKKRAVTLPAFTHARRQAAYIERFGLLATGENSWYVKQINPQTALLHISDFVTWNWKRDYSLVLDSLFTIINQNGTQHLIVDIRGNEGGLDDAKDALFSCLISTPFVKQPAQRLRTFLSVPDSLRPLFRTWNTDLYKPQSAQDFTVIENRFYIPQKNELPDTIYPHKNHFTGNCYLITNAANSSAAFSLASMFKQSRSGLVVGEPTAGCLQGISGGQFFMCRLPHSKIEIDIPLIWLRPQTTMPDQGVLPDVHVPTTQKSIAAQRDAQLDYVLQLIINKQSR
jgi:hypothetical protein